MFRLDNILTYTNANIQIIGIFIAIIGGLVATKILNTKIEKDTLIEKLSKIEKEIRFYKKRKSTDEEEVYKINKEDYIYRIYEKVEDSDFNIEDYEDSNLSLEQRKEIVREIKEMIHSALRIFNIEHTKDEIPTILKQNHIKEGTTEYMIYKYVGENARIRKTFGFGMFDPTDVGYSQIQPTSLYENLEERDLKNRIDKLDEFIEWKLVEEEDIKSKLIAINSLEVKDDVILFIIITVFAIIIPQLVLCIYPIFTKYKFLKYIFAIYSISTFVISMFLMLGYIVKLLLKNSKK